MQEREREREREEYGKMTERYGKDAE